MYEGRSQFPREYPAHEWPTQYGLGIPEIVRVESLERLRRVLRTKQYGMHDSLEEWMEWNIYPVFMDDALKIVAKFSKENATS